tara:strand:- start:13 stop:723 length:711 start_codon:yes stop_codon:yes gene_type:complete
MSPERELTGPYSKPTSGGIAKNAVIMLHGYGSDGNDLIQLAPYFAKEMPNTAFFSPHAPDLTLHGIGRQWFNIDNYRPEIINDDKSEVLELLSNMHEGAKRSSSLLKIYLNTIKLEHNLDYRNIAIMGFSQGTMMAVNVGLTHDEMIGGIVGFSGALIGQNEIVKNIQSPPPIVLIHGKEDDLVPAKASSHMYETLKEINVDINLHLIDNLGHNINEEGLLIARRFLIKNFKKNYL